MRNSDLHEENLSEIDFDEDPEDNYMLTKQKMEQNGLLNLLAQLYKDEPIVCA